MTDKARRRVALENRRLIPGAPLESPGVRVPELPIGVRPYDPPVPPLPPTQPNPRDGFAESYEAKTNQILFSSMREVEIPVYTTRRRWRACDVFADFDFDPADGPPPSFLISIFVYAIVQGSGKVLVASGRFDFDPTFPLGGFPGTSDNMKWIAAARVVTERYQVTARLSQLDGSPNIPGRLRVTVAASDEMTSPPEFAAVGQVSRVGYTGGSANFTGVGRTAPPKLEVLAVRAVKGPSVFGAMQFLQLYDTASDTDATLAASGENPRMVWPMGVMSDAGPIDPRVRYRCVSRAIAGPPVLVHSPFLVISSTETIYTAVASGNVTLTVR